MKRMFAIVLAFVAATCFAGVEDELAKTKEASIRSWSGIRDAILAIGLSATNELARAAADENLDWRERFMANAWENAMPTMENLFFYQTENGIWHLKDDAIPLFGVVDSLPIDPAASNRCHAVYMKRVLLSSYLERGTNSILSRVDAVCRFRGECSTYMTNTTHRGMSRISAVALTETEKDNLKSLVQQVEANNYEMEFQLALERTLHALDWDLFTGLQYLPMSDEERQTLVAHEPELSEHARFHPDEAARFRQSLGCPSSE